jgi:hypothetical protein
MPSASLSQRPRLGQSELKPVRCTDNDFERLAMQTATARELYDQMLKLYPDWVNPGALWTSVRAVKP